MAPSSGFPDEVSDRDADIVSASGSVLPASQSDGTAPAPATLPLEALKQPNPGEYRQRLRRKMAQALESYRQRQQAQGVFDQSGVTLAQSEVALQSLSVPIAEV